MAGLAIGILVLGHEVLLLPPGGAAGRVLVPPLLLEVEALRLRVYRANQAWYHGCVVFSRSHESHRAWR